jgi:hypothetical protein
VCSSDLVVCDLETSRIGALYKYIYIYIYIYDISSLRVNISILFYCNFNHICKNFYQII